MCVCIYICRSSTQTDIQSIFLCICPLWSVGLFAYEMHRPSNLNCGAKIVSVISPQTLSINFDAYFQRIYIISGRQLKRIESVRRSPVFATYSETLNGLSSIRAYHQQDRFIANADQILDDSVKSYFVVLTSSRYISKEYAHSSSFVAFCCG